MALVGCNLDSPNTKQGPFEGQNSHECLRNRASEKSHTPS